MRYKALALQTTCQAVNAAPDRAAAQPIMDACIARIGVQIRASKAFIGPDLRLVVLPEYFMTGFPMGEPMPLWLEKACIAPDGPEYEALGALARQHAVYLSGNAYESDIHFPGLYFQVSFIVSPQGDVVLRYRRLNSMFAPTPHDVWDRFLEIYGYEALFPVVDTEIGRLACIASEEILYPEVARCLMLRGAEVFLHATSEVGSPLLTQKNVAKLARAIENMAYVVSANSAGIAGIDIPFASTDGCSKIIQYEGLILCEASPGESMVANATIDLEALRAARRRTGMSNFIARQRLGLYAETFATLATVQPNGLLNQKPERAYFIQQQQSVIAQLAEKGII
jgi:predicted amidohydrolase